MELKRASRKKVKLKVGFSGASGFGKTYSALLMAYGVTGDWTKIAVIDTENGSADLYADLGEYNSITLTPPFTPERYIEAIHTCEKAGMELIIIDSITHEWDGEGGCLEIVEDETMRSRSKNSYTAWGKVTPRHKAFINAILQSPCHVFTTVRRKQEYEMVQGNGKTTVQKVGTKEITREGFEYEITLNFEFVNSDHFVTASKDRTGLYSNRPAFVIGVETGKRLMEWANNGVDEVAYLIKSIDGATNREELTTIWKNHKHLQNNPAVLESFRIMCEKYPKEEV